MKKSIIAFIALWLFCTLNVVWIAGTWNASKWSEEIVKLYGALTIFCFSASALYGWATSMHKMN